MCVRASPAKRANEIAAFITKTSNEGETVKIPCITLREEQGIFSGRPRYMKVDALYTPVPQ